MFRSNRSVEIHQSVESNAIVFIGRNPFGCYGKFYVAKMWTNFARKEILKKIALSTMGTPFRLKFMKLGQELDVGTLLKILCWTTLVQISTNFFKLRWKLSSDYQTWKKKLFLKIWLKNDLCWQVSKCNEKFTMMFWRRSISFCRFWPLKISKLIVVESCWDFFAIFMISFIVSSSNIANGLPPPATKSTQRKKLKGCIALYYSTYLLLYFPDHLNRVIIGVIKIQIVV